MLQVRTLSIDRSRLGAHAELLRTPVAGAAIAVALVLIFAATGALTGYTPSALLGVGLAVWLAVENGGNDVSKGVAPLVSARLVGERGALVYGTLLTLVGSVVSLFVASGVLKLFTAGLVAPQLAVTGPMVLAIAAGAALWVALATWLSLPVSTTHAIVGAIVAVGSLAYGLAGVSWDTLGGKVVAPLLFSPVAGLVVSWLATASLDRVRLPLGANVVATWFSSGAICFVRAVNDTPKIVAIASLAALSALPTATGVQDYGGLSAPFLLVTLAMAVGSLVKGLAVTQLLARKVSKLDPASCLGAPVATASLVFLSSGWGLPVSTTHVSTCAIVGCGLRDGPGSVNWRVLRDIALSWVITLPLAGILAGGLYALQLATAPLVGAVGLH
jgi:phosphate/sulfate permease